MEIVEEKVVHDVQQLATAVAKDGGGGGRWVSQENWRALNYPPEALAIMGVQPERNPVPRLFSFSGNRARHFQGCKFCRMPSWPTLNQN